MTVASAPTHGGRPSSLALRYALRELRGGLRGFYVFIGCIALGVMAIAGVGSVAASLGEGLAREGRTLLGGDVAFSLIQREAKPQEVAFLRARGEVSVAATLRGMARAADGRAALVELSGGCRLSDAGRIDPRPEMPVADLLAERDGAFGAAADLTCWRGSIQDRRPRQHRRATFQIRSVVGAERASSPAGSVSVRDSGQRSQLARDRVVATRQPGALDLSGQAAGQCGGRSCRDRAGR
jgi:putative ABC transport system permease protein